MPSKFTSGFEVNHSQNTAALLNENTNQQFQLVLEQPSSVSLLLEQQTQTRSAGGKISRASQPAWVKKGNI